MQLQRCPVYQPPVFLLLVAMVFGFLALTPSVSSTAHADLIEYALGKALVYQQTANTAPDALDHAELFGNLFVDNSNDFTSIALSGGDGLSYSTNNGGFDWEGIANYASEAALNAAFPNGTTYTINASGGTLGSFSESITFDASHVFPNTPFFTGTVYSDAQGMDSSQPFTFTWNTPPLDGFQLFIEEVNGPQVFELQGFGGGTATSVTVPIGTFTAGTDYQANLVFFDVEEGIRDNFLTGTEFTGYISQTGMQFTTASVPEPSSFVIMAIALIGIAGRRRRHLRAQT